MTNPRIPEPDIQPCECGAILDWDGPITHCWTHHVDEPTTDSTYRVCGECLHVFETAQDLVDADALVWLEMGEPRRNKPEDIFCCPYCVHDFM